MPKVSIIVVGQEKYENFLPTALKSLDQQTSGDVEIIYVDNTGYNLSTGCNAGIKKAKGQYIVRVDADDWVEPELIEYESDYLDSHPDVDCVYSDFITAQEMAPGVYSLEVTPQESLVHACAAMYRKPVWLGLGGYDESLEYQESVDFWIRFGLAGLKAERLALPLYYYRKHEGQMSSNPERDRVRKQVLEKYGITCT